MARCAAQSPLAARPLAAAAFSAVRRWLQAEAAALVKPLHPPATFCCPAVAVSSRAMSAGPARRVRFQIALVMASVFFPASRSVRACTCSRQCPAATRAAVTTASVAAISPPQAAAASGFAASRCGVALRTSAAEAPVGADEVGGPLTAGPSSG
jgi:hypothetical protein